MKNFQSHKKKNIFKKIKETTFHMIYYNCLSKVRSKTFLVETLDNADFPAEDIVKPGKFTSWGLITSIVNVISSSNYSFKES